MKQNFIGLATSAEFLKAINKAEPVNMTVSKKSGKTDRKFGTSMDSVCVDVSQVKGNEVLYFHWRVYSFLSLQGKALFPEDKPGRYATQAEDIFKQWLQDNQIEFRHAMISMPANYTMFEGSPEFVGFDKENDTFTYKKASQ